MIRPTRTPIKSFRGPGLEKGLRMLADIKSRLDIPVITDVHSFEEIKPASEVVMQFRYLPFMQANKPDSCSSKTGKPVNIKKGQFLAPWDIKNIIDKFTSTGNHNLSITEREHPSDIITLLLISGGFRLCAPLDTL